MGKPKQRGMSPAAPKPWGGQQPVITDKKLEEYRQLTRELKEAARAAHEAKKDFDQRMDEVKAAIRADIENSAKTIQKIFMNQLEAEVEALRKYFRRSEDALFDRLEKDLVEFIAWVFADNAEEVEEKWPAGDNMMMQTGTGRAGAEVLLKLHRNNLNGETVERLADIAGIEHRVLGLPIPPRVQDKINFTGKGYAVETHE